VELLESSEVAETRSAVEDTSGERKGLDRGSLRHRRVCKLGIDAGQRYVNIQYCGTGSNVSRRREFITTSIATLRGHEENTLDRASGAHNPLTASE
jgi:hypothetical protein